jgi:DNA-directed RNA polymerase specialized sigma24 family protein
VKVCVRFMPSQALPPWWDREIDEESGQTLRADVRESAHRVWKGVCSRARYLLGDDADAPELLESTVKAVSRYLNKQGVPPFAAELDGLLSLAFHRSLLRLARQRRRLEPVGGIHEIAQLLRAPDWSEEVDRRLLLEQLAHNLGARSRTILRLRISGHSWKEIGRILEMTPVLARKTFWREIRKAHLRLVQAHETRKTP